MAQRTIQIDTFGGQDPILLTLNMYFDISRIAIELSDIPLGGNYSANVVSELGENLFSNQQIIFPQDLVGEASFSSEKIVNLQGSNWFIMSSRFETIPFWHLIAVEDTFILQPVRNLIFFSSGFYKLK